MSTQKGNSPLKIAEDRRAKYLGSSFGTSAGALAGERFGQLIVQYVAERRNKKLYWVCLCNCGEKISVNQADLRKGRVKSCDNPACIAKSKIEKKWVDYSILAGKA